MYKHTIEQLQLVLDISDAELCKKLNFSISKLNKIKKENLGSDYRIIKSKLISERYELIKFLK